MYKQYSYLLCIRIIQNKLPERCARFNSSVDFVWWKLYTTYLTYISIICIIFVKHENSSKQTCSWLKTDWRRSAFYLSCECSGLTYSFIAVYTFFFKPVNHEPNVSDQGNTVSEITFYKKKCLTQTLYIWEWKYPGLFVW